MDATGPIAVTLRNDMMFHCVMNRSNASLKGLVCALKGLNPKDVKDVVLLNPIDYKRIDLKVIVLDVKVILNNNEIMDIELQLYDMPDWEERSLLYLCRSFDNINAGDEYRKLKPTTFVAIMNDPISEEIKEFYSHYQLLNTKTHQPYSSLLNLNVLYLNQTDLATQEDIDHDLVYWAKLFKANNWEELKQLCLEKPEFKEVTREMYHSNIISQERTIFEAHQKYLMDARSYYGNGLEQGREEGLEQGLEQGLKQGREEGLEQGREEGLEQGREEGLEQGREESRVKIENLQEEIKRLKEALAAKA